jgi:hypothetical protein
MDTQYKVAIDEPAPGAKPRTLNFRKFGINAADPVAGLQPRAIVHVTGPANKAGYAEGYIFGWLGKDDRTLYSDPYESASIDALLFVRSAFEAQGEPDVYGWQPGAVRGWLYLAYLEEIVSNVPEDAP